MLVAARKLEKLTPPLNRREFENRLIFVTSGFMAWMEGPLFSGEAGGPDLESPYEQVAARAKQFVRGDVILHPEQLHMIRHRSGFVWELKTPQIRIFGAFPKIDVFVAVRGADAEWLKGPPSLYDGVASEVERELRQMGLDEGGLISTGRIEHVVSNAS